MLLVLWSAVARLLLVVGLALASDPLAARKYSSLASDLPFALQYRSDMPSLISDLLAVLGDSSINATASRRRSVSTTSTSTDQYRQVIESNAEQLSTLADQSTTASKELRASLVCEVSKVLFGSNTIAYGSSSYTTTEQENW